MTGGVTRRRGRSTAAYVVLRLQLLGQAGAHDLAPLEGCCLEVRLPRLSARRTDIGIELHTDGGWEDGEGMAGRLVRPSSFQCWICLAGSPT